LDTAILREADLMSELNGSNLKRRNCTGSCATAPVRFSGDVY